jgi:hypothetical protein
MVREWSRFSEDTKKERGVSLTRSIEMMTSSLER